MAVDDEDIGFSEDQLAHMEADASVRAAVQEGLKGLRAEGAAMTWPSVLLHASRTAKTTDQAKLIAKLILRQARREGAA